MSVDHAAPGRVLHIIDPSSLGNVDVEAALSARPERTATCADVYTGLARLLGGAETFAAVLLCTDFLRPSELEFISSAERMAPDVRVLVYASDGRRDLVEPALRVGAVEATRTTLSEIFGTEQVVTQASEAESDEHEAGRVAVPWARDVQAPRRVPPGAQRGRGQATDELLSVEEAAELGVASDEAERVPVDSEGGSDEPLLSAEEISYLLGSEESESGKVPGGGR